jgi:hypothetical protein
VLGRGLETLREANCTALDAEGVELGALPVIDDGVVTAMAPSAADIIERRSAADRLEATEQLARSLRDATSEQAVALAIINYAPAAFGADMANLGSFDADRTTLVMVQPDALDLRIAKRYPTIRLAHCPSRGRRQG